VPAWSLAPVVEAYQAMRGASFLVAVTFAAEIGDVRRFDTPRQLMSFLGLIPAESSTGDTVRRKGLTLGRQSPRAAGAHRSGLDRLEGLPKSVLDIAWKAQVRLCARYRRLSATGKKLPVVWRRSLARWPPSCGPSDRRSRQRKSWTNLFFALRAGSGARRWGTPVASCVAGFAPDARPLDRGSPETQYTEGGNQPADKSLINLRLSLRSQLCAAITLLTRASAERALNRASPLYREHKRASADLTNGLRRSLVLCEREPSPGSADAAGLPRTGRTPPENALALLRLASIGLMLRKLYCPTRCSGTDSQQLLVKINLPSRF